jgi:serine/threonine-protein kinase
LQRSKTGENLRDIGWEVSMIPERWREVEELYHAARERGRQVLTDADPELRREVEELLDQESTGGPLDRPAAELLPELFAETCTIQLAAGQCIGQYKIAEHLGAGGMGTVYRATDTKLHRSVALKMLLPGMLKDATSVARFEREARVLASLNHAQIAAIYGLEEYQGVRFLALEYVPGPTLAERLRRGSLPVHEAIRISKQIAEALEAAHAKGIIHRDLKPANIKVCDNGQVKVLDFGLAKPIEERKAVAPDATTATLVEELTKSMTIVGTPAYMSPEQVSGRELDVRTDIWSFGCVLYESLTGKRAFEAKTVAEVLAAVLEREPNWAALPQTTPEPLRLLLKRCLRKDPNSRLHDIGDAKIELEDLLAPVPAEAGRKPRAITRREAIGTISGAAVGAAAMGLFSIRRYRGAVPRNLAQFAISAPEGVFVPSFNTRVAISPEGEHVAFNTFSSGLDLFYIRSLTELEPKRVKDVPTGGAAFFSPDGRWVGFFIAATGGAASFRFSPDIHKMALSGGAPVDLCPTDAFSGGTWADDETIYWIDLNPGGLMSIAAAGGPTKEVARIDFDKGERQYKYPCALPGAKSVLAAVATADIASFDDARIVAFSPHSGQRKILLEGGTRPRYSLGYLFYGHDGKILAVRFDADRLEVQGQPFTVLEGVQMSRNTGVANFDVSTSGDLAYVPGICDGGSNTLVWVDRKGQAETINLSPRSFLHPRLSPDDRRLAIEVEGPNHNVYVYDFDRGVLADITTDGVSHWPVWSPDGKQLAYRSGPMGHFKLWDVPADRSRAPQQVPATGIMQSAESWSPDGRTILYTAGGLGIPPSIMAARLDGDHQAEEVAKEKAPEGSPKFSPDGHWLAYCSNESGKPQVYVQAFPGPGPKIQISVDGGTDPVWGRRGGELYYRNGDSMMAVSVTTAPSFKAGRPQELWKGHFSHGMSSSCGPPGVTSSNYDVTADGKRFLMIKDDDQDRAASTEMVVVLGWVDEVRRLAQKS